MDYKAGMFIYALVFLLGIVFVQQLSVLPDTLHLIYLSLFGAVLLALLRVFSHSFSQPGIKVCIALTNAFIILIIGGILYSSYFAKHQLSYQLNDTFIGKSIVISGRVSSIPVSRDEVQRFEFDVDSYQSVRAGGKVDSSLKKFFPQKLRLSWYYGTEVNADEKWQLEVRLKPPHGFMNPGGFDYEAWLFQHGIHATGYVRKSALNLKQQAASAWSINAIRQTIGQQIDALADRDAGMDVNKKTAAGIDKEQMFSLLKALAIGDKSSITSQQWSVLTQTGTSHLMAISGLHIGLASLFAFLLIRRIVPVYIMQRIPAQHVALVGGMLSALLYAVIAGLTIPTQRAIIMLFALVLMMLIRRNTRPLDSLGLALFLVLLYDPLAVLSAGFWFSFSAVAVIFISVMTAQTPHDGDISAGRKVLKALKQWLRLQLIISIFLLPLSLFMFQQVSLVSPLANLFMIPYVSFLVVPVILLAIVCRYIYQDLAELLFDIAARLLDLVWPLLSSLAQQPFAIWVKGDIDTVELLLATTTMLLMLFAGKLSLTLKHLKLSRYTQNPAANNWFLRFSAGLLSIPLFITGRPVLPTGDFKLTVLDVGQGSAAVVQTQNHALVFDSGAKFGDSLNAGSAVVIPYLRAEDIGSIDYLIISHGDNDHIGGAQAVLDAYPETLLIGRDIADLVVNNENEGNKRLCFEGLHWRWDGVDFKFLSPAENAESSRTKARNNHSCVLRVSSAAGSVLLTGDIESKVEKKLVKKYAGLLFSDVLVVPHHGSYTSSSIPFINSVSPEISVISAGYKNRYKLPASRVVKRYASLDRKIIQTADSGAIIISLSVDKGPAVELYRQGAQKYWHHVTD